MTHAAVKTLSALSLAALVAVGTWTPPAEAFNFGNMMNPNRWMNGGGRDRYYDDGPWGGWGPGSWGGPYGGYGPGWGLPYGGYGPGWGGPYGAPYGGVPGYGWGAPGYGVAPTPAAQPAAGAASDRGEVEALKRRVQELETSQRQSPAAAPMTAPAAPPAAAPARDWPAAPVFRPVDRQ